MSARNRLLGWLLVAGFWAGVLALLGAPPWIGRNDFVVFYCGAKLAFSSQLYSPEACYEIRRGIFGDIVPSLTYIRMPFHAMAFAPLAWLPYQWAYAVFQGLQLAAIGWAVRALARERGDFLWFGLACPGLILGVANGQDVGLLFALVVAVWRALREGDDTRAGLLLSLCAMKPHLFLLMPVVLALRERWRAVGAAAAGVAALLAVSFANGVDWPERFLTAVSNPGIDPAHGLLISLRNPVSLLFEGSMAAEAALMIAIAAAVAWFARRAGLGEAFALALAMGLLLGRHAFVQDTVLVLAAMGIWITTDAKARAIPLLALLASPPAALAVVAGWPVSVAYPLLLLVLLGVALAATLQTQTVPLLRQREHV